MSMKLLIIGGVAGGATAAARAAARRSAPHHRPASAQPAIRITSTMSMAPHHSGARRAASRWYHRRP